MHQIEFDFFSPFSRFSFAWIWPPDWKTKKNLKTEATGARTAEGAGVRRDLPGGPTGRDYGDGDGDGGGDGDGDG